MSAIDAATGRSARMSSIDSTEQSYADVVIDEAPWPAIVPTVPISTIRAFHERPPKLNIVQSIAVGLWVIKSFSS